MYTDPLGNGTQEFTQALLREEMVSPCQPPISHFPSHVVEPATSTTLLDGHVMLAEKEGVWLLKGSLRMALEL